MNCFHSRSSLYLLKPLSVSLFSSLAVLRHTPNNIANVSLLSQNSISAVPGLGIWNMMYINRSVRLRMTNKYLHHNNSA